MTCECSNPDCTGRPDHAAIARAIHDHGQFIMAVLGDTENAPFLYTIGRTERGQPELLIELEDSGEIKAAGHLLNYLGPRDVQPGHTVGSVALNDVFLVAEPPDDDDYLHEEFVVQADHYYGRRVDVLCVVGVKRTDFVPGSPARIGRVD
jgi:hypothetical protein